MKPPKNVPEPPNWKGTDKEFHITTALEGHIYGEMQSDEEGRDPLVNRGE